jgi:hypothetical protein
VYVGFLGNWGMTARTALLPDLNDNFCVRHFCCADLRTSDKWPEKKAPNGAF